MFILREQFNFISLFLQLFLCLFIFLFSLGNSILLPFSISQRLLPLNFNLFKLFLSLFNFASQTKRLITPPLILFLLAGVTHIILLTLHVLFALNCLINLGPLTLHKVDRFEFFDFAHQTLRRGRLILNHAPQIILFLCLLVAHRAVLVLQTCVPFVHCLEIAHFLSKFKRL